MTGTLTPELEAAIDAAALAAPPLTPDTIDALRGILATPSTESVGSAA